jgi:hypothetical protein
LIKYARFYLRKYYWIGVLLVPLLILLPGLTGFPYPPQPGAYSDISITHYPNVLFLRDSIFRGHTIPLWSPTILSGYPFDADPLSGLWYPPGWLALVLPLPMAFNISIFLHLLWMGIGMYLLLRAEDLPEFSALLGAIVSITLPKLFAHYGAGHLSLLYAIAWTPWLLYISRRYYQSTQLSKRPVWCRVLEQPALVWAMVLLADVRWAAFAGLLWWYYLLFHKIVEGGGNLKLRYMGSLMLQTILGALLAAPLLIPVVEYANLSTRASMSAADIATFSLPPAKILGLFFPDFAGFYEWVIYCGALVILLLIVGFARSKQSTATRCWLGVALFSLIFALGSNIPFFSLIAEIPGFNLLRVPSRMVFITGISLAALAAHQLQWLFSGLITVEIRRSRMILASLITFVLLLTAAVWIITRKPPYGFIWGSAFIMIGAIWLMLLMQNRLAIKSWQLGVLALCLLDLWGVDLSLFTTRPVATVLAESEQVASYLSKEPGDFRVYSPSYSLPQQTSAFYGLEMASGVDPLQLQSYADFMEASSGVQQNGYSVVLPPLIDESTIANDIPAPDTKLLGLLNVGYILSAYPLQADGLDHLSTFDKMILYKNRYMMPRAWVELGDEIHPAEVLTREPNIIRLKASGPGMLSLAEISYPGWNVWVDDRPAAIKETAGLLRSVQLGIGTHEIVFRYIPYALLYGVGLMVLGVVLIIVIGRGRS